MFSVKTKIIVGLSLTVIFLLLIGIIFYLSANLNPGVKIDLSRDSVINKIEKLGNLETSSFSIEKVIEAGQQGNVFQNLLYGDKILLIAHGKVIAGVDLSSISSQDVNIQGKELTINLPATKILSSTLDNSKTTVYDRTQGLLTHGNKDLESEARVAAEKSITKAACDSGILQDAKNNAIERIRQLFEFAGFTTVKVNIQAGSC